jgi:hypothetical protein
MNRMGIVDWSDVAEDSDRWRTVRNAVIIFVFHEMRGISWFAEEQLIPKGLTRGISCAVCRLLMCLGDVGDLELNSKSNQRFWRCCILCRSYNAFVATYGITRVEVDWMCFVFDICRETFYSTNCPAVLPMEVSECCVNTVTTRRPIVEGLPLWDPQVSKRRFQKPVWCGRYEK